MIPMIQRYRCPNCDEEGDENRFWRDDEDRIECGDCGEAAEHIGERTPSWVSVALCEVHRLYGGPEEGGWYYDAGYRIASTVRCFEEGDFPQVGLYEDLLRSRNPTPRGGQRHVVRTYAEQLPPESWPKNRPTYR